MSKRSLILIVVVAVFLSSAAAQCAQPQVVEKEVVVTKEVEVEKEVVVTKEVEKVVTQEVIKEVEPDYVTIRMNWTYGGFHAWFFYGKDERFWRDEGIIVELREGNGSGNVARTISSKSDTFAYVTPDPVFYQIAQGAPLKFIYTVDGATQWAYMCRDDRGIETVEDLYGKIILASPGSASLTIHPVFVKRAGLDPNKMEELTLVDPSAIVPTVLAGKADCILGGASDQAPLMRAGGIEPVIFEAKDYGVGGPGGAIIAHQDTIDQNPDLVARLVRGAQKAQEACTENPEACVEALLRSHPQQDPEAIKQQFLINVPYSVSPKNTTGCYGAFIEEDWNDLYVLLKNVEDSPIESDLPVTAYYDDSFVPSCE
jgi:NitT/TauT family transport system substrate-binding protein